MVNTFKYIDKKFQIDPRKTIGDMHIYFREDLHLLNCLCSEIQKVLGNAANKCSERFGQEPANFSRSKLLIKDMLCNKAIFVV